MDSMETIPKQQHDKEIEELRERYKPNNAFNIPVHSTLDFFKWWCVILRPFVHLTEREIDVVASFLRQRSELAKITSDPAIIDTLMMSPDTLNKVVKECEMTKQYFYVVMSSLKKKNVINGHINPVLIPNMKEGETFKLTFLFKEDSKGV